MLFNSLLLLAIYQLYNYRLIELDKQIQVDNLDNINTKRTHQNTFQTDQHECRCDSFMYVFPWLPVNNMDAV